MGSLENRKVIRLLKQFKKNLHKKYKIQKAILFGSRARGDWLLTSDIDIILISDDFTSIPFRRRMADVLQYWDEDIDVEILCYTPDEFKRKKKEIGIVKQAIREGVLI